MSGSVYALSVMTPHALAEWFNTTHRVMTPVTYWPGVREGRVLEGKTRGPAWVLPSGEPVVSVTGYAGGIHLTHVACASHETHGLDVNVNGWPLRYRDTVKALPSGLDGVGLYDCWTWSA